MEADFSGYATKAGLKCSDGRTIMPDAFKHQDQAKVPLVWQHGHTDPENVLGHAILENRDDGVYAYGFFNKSQKASHARQLLEHGDINMMSIWANDLIERSKRVLHGAIREVSLVLSGANPGAVIENVTIRHSDDSEDILDDEAIIYTGLTLEHSNEGDKNADDKTKVDGDKVDENADITHASGGDKTIQEVYDSMTEEQKQVLHFMVGEALAAAGSDNLQQSGLDDLDDDASFQEVYDSMDDNQKQLLHSMLDKALNGKRSDDKLDDDDTKGNGSMKHNVFEDDKNANKPAPVVLSHSDVQTIVSDATKVGSLKEAVEAYALSHGIEDIDILFPEAKTLADAPELFGRRVEWVNKLLNAVRKSPFARIKTLQADITVQEARAKGYIKGNLKKEEFFRVARRITTPQTIYKKQKLDRDDIIDITDFDVVVWLKGEMRIMLDEELARAILVGDGRAVDDPDKINEDNIRPVATDNEVYTTTVNVNLDDANSSIQEVVDAIVTNRSQLRGSGLPTMFVSETYIARFMLLRDGVGRRIYRNLDELAAELRVQEIVSVEVLEEDPTIVCILFNPIDYVVGADKGGNVSMFDDFDIDYNQYKYLIETRVSGALVKLKAALVVRAVAGTDVLLADPTDPTFDAATGVVTIPTTANVTYYNAVTNAALVAGAQPALAVGETLNVTAEPDAGFYFANNANSEWSFTNFE